MLKRKRRQPERNPTVRIRETQRYTDRLSYRGSERDGGGGGRKAGKEGKSR